MGCPPQCRVTIVLVDKCIMISISIKKECIMISISIKMEEVQSLLLYFTLITLLFLEWKKLWEIALHTFTFHHSLFYLWRCECTRVWLGGCEFSRPNSNPLLWRWGWDWVWNVKVRVRLGLECEDVYLYIFSHYNSVTVSVIVIIRIFILQFSEG